jgi:hypothetical protein
MFHTHIELWNVLVRENKELSTQFNNNFPEMNFSSKTVEQFKDVSDYNGAIETLRSLLDFLK